MNDFDEPDPVFDIKNDEFEESGEWWIKGKPEVKLCGVLKYSKGTGILELEGVVNSISEMLTTTGRKVICGDVKGMKGILLIDCHCTRKNAKISPGNSIIKYTFTCHKIFTNCDFKELTDVYFKECLIRFHYLESWSEYANRDMSFVVNNSDIEIRLKQLKPVKVTNSDDDDDSITSSPMPEYLQNYPDENMKQNVFFIVRSKKSMDFEETKKMICKLQNFLSFVIDEPTHHVQVIGYQNEGGLERNYSKNAVGVFYDDITSTLDLKYKRLDEDEILFFLDSEQDFQNIVKKWFEISDTYETMVNEISAVINKHHMTVDSIIMAYSKAFESYYKKYANVDGKMTKGISNHVRERSLNDKLVKIIKNHTMAIYWLNDKSVDKSVDKKIKEFAEEIKNIRNKTAHGNFETDIDETKLVYAICRMRMLLEIIILTELCFSQKLIKDIIKKREKLFPVDVWV